MNNKTQNVDSVDVESAGRIDSTEGGERNTGGTAPGEALHIRPHVEHRCAHGAGGQSQDGNISPGARIKVRLPTNKGR